MVCHLSTAFKKLDSLYGTWRAPSTLKKGFNLPSSKMANTDLAALLKAPEILRVCRRPKYVRSSLPRLFLTTGHPIPFSLSLSPSLSLSLSLSR